MFQSPPRHPISFPRPLAAVALLGALLSPAAAIAWNGETRAAVAKAALTLSPAARARIPSTYEADFFKQVVEEDQVARAGLGLMSLEGSAAEAEKALAALNHQKIPSAYNRAILLGRYVRHVADAIRYPSLMAEKGRIGNFFLNLDFVLFRESVGLSQPLAASLVSIGQRLRTMDDEDRSNPALLRLAANAIAEALLLLPAHDPAAALDDGAGRVLFLVNRLSSGSYLAQDAKRERSGYYRPEVYKAAREGELSVDYREATGSYTLVNKRALGVYIPNLLERGGVQIAEWTPYVDGAKTHVTALVYNATAKCVRRLNLRVGKSGEMPLDVVLPGKSLAYIRFDVAPGIKADDVRLESYEGACPKSTGPGGPIAVLKPQAFSNSGRPPDFEQEMEIPKPKEGS